jgi:antitoxin StbD
MHIVDQRTFCTVLVRHCSLAGIGTRLPHGNKCIFKSTFKNIFKSTQDNAKMPLNHSRENMMPSLVLAEMCASISELKKDPMGAVAAGAGLPVAILNRNEPVFYCIPATAYEALMNKLEDFELNAIADARMNDGQAFIPVTLDDL